MLFIAFIFLFKNSILSQNLIQNCSFENHVGIDCSTGSFSVVNNWIPLGSPDYFSSICVGSVGIPYNGFGIAPTVQGNYYAGILVYHSQTEYKEYIQQNLINPLIAGKTYYVIFYITRADRIVYSIKNIGAYFSVSQPTTSMGYVSAVAQIENTSGYLTDTIGWTKIDGYYTAQGGEQYITIGNFNSNANTDTLKTGTTNPIPFEPDDSYYYIDSVSLYDSLDYALITNIKKMEDMVNVKLYPNPTTSKLKLSIQNLKNEQLGIKITDVLGREVKTLEYEEEIDLSDLENGIYFLSFYQNKQVLTTKKIIKQ